MNHIMASHRILYVGNDLNLLKFLQAALSDCLIVRCPGGYFSYTFIESKINYSLLLFDEEPLNTTAAKLKRFARRQAHRQQTPILIFEKSDDFASLVKTILRALHP